MTKKKIQKNTNQSEQNVVMDEVLFPQEEESLRSLCQKIREARLAKSLSLESVSGHLHIGVKILEAIEEGKPENGPTPVFFRGLVRTYCEFLGLDKTEIIDKLDNFLKVYDQGEVINTKTIKPVFAIKESHTIRNTISIIIILLGGYLLYTIYFLQSPFFPSQNNITNLEEPLVIVPTSETTGKLDIQEESNTFADLNERQKKTTKKITKKILTKTKQPLTLEVEALEDTWVSVSVDGNEISDYRLRAEEIQQWEAKENYQITIGNTQVVRVLLNGREIETNRTNQLLIDWLVDENYLP